jgi:hypothetical protein
MFGKELVFVTMVSGIWRFGFQESPLQFLETQIFIPLNNVIPITNYCKAIKVIKT